MGSPSYNDSPLTPGPLMQGLGFSFRYIFSENRSGRKLHKGSWLWWPLLQWMCDYVVASVTVDMRLCGFHLFAHAKILEVISL